MRSKSIPRSLGEEIRDRRTQKRLSQEKLAQLAGIHTNVIGRLERGIGNPTLTTLISIAVKLNASLAELFVGAERR